MPEADTTPYTDEELGVALFRAGIGNRNIEEILAALHQVERLCSWYRTEDQKGRPTEHEVVSHVVLPIFLGLGWSHQQVAVEWRRMDMAFFKRTPTSPDNCVMVLEAKGLGDPLNERFSQPQRYVEAAWLGSVRYVVTTDAPTLYLYERTAEVWTPDPVGHLDVVNIQRRLFSVSSTKSRSSPSSQTPLRKSSSWGSSSPILSRHPSTKPSTYPGSSACVIAATVPEIVLRPTGRLSIPTLFSSSPAITSPYLPTARLFSSGIPPRSRS